MAYGTCILCHGTWGNGQPPRMDNVVCDLCRFTQETGKIATEDPQAYQNWYASQRVAPVQGKSILRDIFGPRSPGTPSKGQAMHGSRVRR